MLFGNRRGKMFGFNFTETCRVALLGAREEAARLGHEYVGTEHILLALLRPRDGAANGLLAALGVPLDDLRRRVEAGTEPGKAAPRRDTDLPYTSRAKKVLELAMGEARDLGDEHVDAVHLLLGVVREEKGAGAQALADFGVTAEKIIAARRGEAPPAAGSSYRIEVDDASDRSIYEQIIGQVQEGVATGRLAPGDRLPTVRSLADELNIAPGTVARAYAELERLGVVTTDGARGTRVAGRERPAMAKTDREGTLEGLLRPVVVAAFHLGAGADELRRALERAMRDIFPKSGAA